MANHLLCPPPPTPCVFSGLMPQRTSTREQQPRAEKGPFSPQQMVFSNQPSSVGMLQRLLGAPPLTLGSCQESSRHGSLPLSPPSLHIPPSISSLSRIPYETLFSVPQLAFFHKTLLPWALLAAVTTPNSTRFSKLVS